MATSFLSLEKLQYFKGKIDTIYASELAISGQTLTIKSKSGAVLGTYTLPNPQYSDATQTAHGLMSTDDKKKLDGISSGANKVEASTNGKIKIDGVDTVVYTPDAYTAYSTGLYKITVDDKGNVSSVSAVLKADITGLGIPAQDTTYTNATDTASGLMSADDKTKLDGISSGANKVESSTANGSIKIDGVDTKVYTAPAQTAYSSGLYKITTNAVGAVISATAVTKNDITGLGIPAQDTTYDEVTTSTAGLMSASDKTKLDSVDSNADANVIETIKVNNASLAVTGKAVNIDLSAYALKSDISSAVNYKGSVDSYSDLPTSPEKGDMYNITNADETHNIVAGENVVWTGEVWDDVGGLFAVTEISEEEIDALFA